MSPVSGALQVSRQMLIPHAPVLNAIPSRCINNNERFKGERRKKASFTKEDKKRLEMMEKHRKDPTAAIKHALKHAGIKIGPPDTSRPITITCTG